MRLSQCTAQCTAYTLLPSLSKSRFTNSLDVIYKPIQSKPQFEGFPPSFCLYSQFHSLFVSYITRLHTGFFFKEPGEIINGMKSQFIADFFNT